MSKIRRHARLVAPALALLLTSCGFLNGRNWTMAAHADSVYVTTHQVESAMISKIAYPVFCHGRVACVVDLLAAYTPEDPMRDLLYQTSAQQPVRSSLEYVLYSMNRSSQVDTGPNSPCMAFRTAPSYFGWTTIGPSEQMGCIYVMPPDLS